MKTVVDSCGWLEYFSDGPNAPAFAEAIEHSARLIVPAITVFEVFKRVYAQRGEQAALQAAALMGQGHVVPFDESLACMAAKLSVDEKMPMADSIVLATARRFGATVYTQDDDFKGKDGVRYIEHHAKGKR